jgi:hypothetical protein
VFLSWVWLGISPLWLSPYDAVVITSPGSENRRGIHSFIHRQKKRTLKISETLGRTKTPRVETWKKEKEKG